MKIAELLGKLWLQVLMVGLFLLLIISKTRFKYFEELFIVSVLGYSISLIFISVLRKRHKGSGGGILHLFEITAKLFAPAVWGCLLIFALMLLGSI